jgi:FkbM family methyltransferase
MLAGFRSPQWGALRASRVAERWAMVRLVASARSLAKNLRVQIDAALLRAVPAVIYCRASSAARQVLHPERRGGSRRTVFEGEHGLGIRWRDGQEFYFAHPKRYLLYVWPDGLERRIRQMSEKYQDGEVRIRPGDTVVDIGANVGEFSLMASRQAARVLALEPDPNVYPSLAKNAAGWPNVTALRVAVGATDGRLEFYLSTGWADSSAVEPQHWTDKVTVDVRTLASLAQERGLGRVDFLKVEAEGFEPEILEGGGTWLRNVRDIAVDCGPERQGVPTLGACRSLLVEAGFDVHSRDWVLFGVNRTRPS